MLEVKSGQLKLISYNGNVIGLPFFKYIYIEIYVLNAFFSAQKEPDRLQHGCAQF